VAYTDAAGQRQTFRADFGSTNKWFDEGAKVPVAYHPGKPQQARLTTFLAYWLGPAAIAVLGLTALFAGTVLIVFRNHESWQRRMTRPLRRTLGMQVDE
jgi:hypothetical protein